MEGLLTVISGQRGRSAMMDGDVDGGTVPCGQGVGLIQSAPTVAEVMASLVSGAESLIRQLAARAHS